MLRFSPTAWAKLLYLRDLGDSEIGGFGIAAADDLLFVEDVGIVLQTCTFTHVAFDDAAVANFFDVQVDLGRRPEQFGRIWIHTHPGNSAEPSAIDENTFARVFGGADWAVMFILARGGASYARLRFNVGPGAELEIPVDVDYLQPFAAADFVAWSDEYMEKVQIAKPEPVRVVSQPSTDADRFDDSWWPDAWDEYADFDLEEANHGCTREF